VLLSKNESVVYKCLPCYIVNWSDAKFSNITMHLLLVTDCIYTSVLADFASVRLRTFHTSPWQPSGCWVSWNFEWSWWYDLFMCIVICLHVLMYVILRTWYWYNIHLYPCILRKDEMESYNTLFSLGAV